MRPRWEKRLDFFSPFNGRDACPVQILLNPDGQRLVRIAESIQVDMEQRQASAEVFMHEGERGTCYVLGDTEAAREALDESGFARTEVAGERDHIAALQFAGESFAELERLLDAVRVNLLRSDHNQRG
jgi:hypothetical protein